LALGTCFDPSNINFEIHFEEAQFFTAVALVTTVTVIGDSSAGVGTATSFFLQRTEKNSNFLWFGIISALFVAEEFCQVLIPHRTFSLVDLAASIASTRFATKTDDDCSLRVGSSFGNLHEIPQTRRGVGSFFGKL